MKIDLLRIKYEVIFTLLMFALTGALLFYTIHYQNTLPMWIITVITFVMTFITYYALRTTRLELIKLSK